MPIFPMPMAPNLYAALLLLFLLPEFIPLPDMPPKLLPLLILSPPEFGIILFPNMFIAFLFFIATPGKLGLFASPNLYLLLLSCLPLEGIPEGSLPTLAKLLLLLKF